jgi:glycosyltransferase involved in cell wall biosynthesis
MAASLTSIILPAYVPTKELERITQQCLESLAQTTPPDSYELIVVDNGSIESAARLLREHADIYIRKEAPLGYARATNTGLAPANHDWLVVRNTDLEFQEPGWLKRFQADYAQTPGGILSAMDETAESRIYYASCGSARSSTSFRRCRSRKP